MPVKRVTDIVIGTNVTESTAGGVGVVALGVPGTLLSGAPTIATNPVIQIRRLLGTNQWKLSLPIHGLMVRNWTGRSGAAGTNQVATVTTINAISDQEYGIYVSINSDKETSLGNRRYYVQYMSDATATVAEITAGIAAAGTANTGLSQYVATTSSATQITFTALAPNIYFTIGKAIGFDTGTTLTQFSTSPDPGIGTYDQVLALEEIAKGYEGYLGERRTFVGNIGTFSRPTYFSVGTANAVTAVYDVYVIDHDQPFDSQGENVTEGKPTSTYICTPVNPSTWSQGNFETIMNSWMASTPGAFAGVNL